MIHRYECITEHHFSYLNAVKVLDAGHVLRQYIWSQTEFGKDQRNMLCAWRFNNDKPLPGTKLGKGTITSSRHFCLHCINVSYHDTGYYKKNVLTKIDEA